MGFKAIPATVITWVLKLAATVISWVLQLPATVITWVLKLYLLLLLHGF